MSLFARLWDRTATARKRLDLWAVRVRIRATERELAGMGPGEVRDVTLELLAAPRHYHATVLGTLRLHDRPNNCDEEGGDGNG